uniref:Uncharacterized protein n=1 Tax=Tetranychus urticae TaxID=32264 RepID=T1KPC2_TETUR
MVSVNNHTEPPITSRTRSHRSQSNSPRLVIDEGNSVNQETNAVNGDPDENVSNGTTQSVNADPNGTNQEAIADRNTNNVDNETNQEAIAVRNTNNVDNETNQVINANNGQVDGNIQSSGSNQEKNGDFNGDIEGDDSDGDSSSSEIDDTRRSK